MNLETPKESLPVKPSREEAPARSRSEEFPGLDQNGILRSVLLYTERIVVIPFMGERSVHNRCAVEVPNTAKKV